MITAPVSRRYSAVLVAQPALPTVATELQRTWVALTGDTIGQSWSIGRWTAAHVRHLSLKNYYSSSLLDEADRKVPGGFVHDLIVAATGSSDDRYLLIAAPYVYFLSDCLRTLEAKVGQPRPWYQTVNLSRAFKVLADPIGEEFRVRQFSVQHRGSSSADRLSVSGRNPLRSDLGHQFAAEAGDAAYGVRIESGTHEAFRTNVNCDRHGNLWWFHRGRGSLENVLACVDLLRTLHLVEETRLFPPDHKDDDE